MSFEKNLLAFLGSHMFMPNVDFSFLHYSVRATNIFAISKIQLKRKVPNEYLIFQIFLKAQKAANIC